MFAITNDVDLLKTLTATLIDSVNGYREAAEIVRDSKFRQCFLRCAAERRRAVERLQEEVRRQGGDAQEDPSLLGQAHQLWLDLRTAVQDGNERAILDEVERGESYLQQKFQAVVEDPGIKGETRRAIEETYRSVCTRFRNIPSLERVAEDS